MGIEKRVIDGKEVDVNVEVVDGKEVVTPVLKDKPKEVSQEAIDRIYKQMKEYEEKLVKSEGEKVDLVERIKKLEEEKPTPEPEPTTKTYGRQNDGTWVFPQTEEEWDDLIAEKPSFGTDLRRIYTDSIANRTNELRESHKKSALKVAQELLPDMYKKDSEEKLILDKNGYPVPDDKSETFKLFYQVAIEEGVDEKGNPVLWATKNGPELIALKTKQVLGTDREVELKKKAQEELENKNKMRENQIKNNQTVPPGQQPPTEKPVKVSFSSDYEKQRAEQKVAQGVYKSLEEYCRIRDNATVPYGRGNV